MTEINSVTTLVREGDVDVITLNSPPVNALSFNVRDGLYGASSRQSPATPRPSS